MSKPAAAETTSAQETNPYGSPPGSGISMPPYSGPTSSIKNRNNYFPQTEELGDDEMRITFMGSNPFQPPPGYDVGYLARQVAPRLGMATHFSFDLELLGKAVADVRTHYNGMFAFGIDHTVVNVTKDAIWIREAALPDTANTTRPSAQWMVQEMFGGAVSKEIVLPRPAHTVADVQSRDVRDLEIKPEKYTPPDQIRPWVREWPTDIKMDPAALLGQQPGKK